MLEKLLTPIVLPYVRVSSEKQETYSPEAQNDIATDWCSRNSYIKLESIIETGSGESIDNRPGILRALEMARRKQYNILFVIEPSRIARKMSDAISIIDLFRSIGIKVATPGKIYDFANYNDSFMAHINSSIDELERQRIRERSERGRRKAAESGNWIGQQLPYGYSTSRVEIPGQKRPCTKIVLHEKEKEGLLKIIELYEAGLSGREIAEELTRLGYETKYGNKLWDKSVPIELLKSTWLYGEGTAFKKTSYRDKGKRIYIQQPQWITFPVPALISKERWLSIQHMIKTKTFNSKKQTAFEYLFADKLVCGNCLKEAKKRNISNCSVRIGHRTDWYIHTLKDGTVHKEPKYPYYVCVGRSRHLRDWVCTLPQIRSTTLDEKLWEETVKIIKQPAVIYDAVVYSQRETIEKKRLLEDRIQKKSTELKDLQDSRKEATKKFLTTKLLTEADLKESLEIIDSNINKAELEIEALKNTKISDPKESVSKESLEQVCNAIEKNIGNYDFKLKRKLVDSLYEQIVVDLDWSVTLQGKIPLTPEGIDFLHNKFSNYLTTHQEMPLGFRARSC
ncbi:MAG: recombinase family protein [Chitinispirillaceae bacterium]|nr:recombinase family protein [Chitinispirillaceae bacterium]